MLTTNGGSSEVSTMKCDKSSADPKVHVGPSKLLKVQDDGLRIARCEGCGNIVTRRPKVPEKTQPGLELAERPNDRTTLFNTDQRSGRKDLIF